MNQSKFLGPKNKRAQRRAKRNIYGKNRKESKQSNYHCSHSAGQLTIFVSQPGSIHRASVKWHWIQLEMFPRLSWGLKHQHTQIFEMILGENLSPAMRGDICLRGKSLLHTVYSDVQARSLEPKLRQTH